MLSKRQELAKRWKRLSATERAAILGAVIAVVGSLLATICGSTLAVVTSSAFQINATSDPTTFPTTAPPTPTPPSPGSSAPNPVSTRPPVHIAGLRFQDWRIGAIYGLSPNASTSSLLATSDWEERRRLLNSEGYHVLYWAADFSELPADFPHGQQIPPNTLSDEKPHPIVPLEYELWNLHPELPIVIDEISLDALDYIPPISEQLNLYYLAPPAGGGGGEIPQYEFDVSLSPSSELVNLFQESSQRVIVEPRSSILVVSNIVFNTPGRYSFNSRISYHLPDGRKEIIETDIFIFSWTEEALVDGSKMKVIK